MSPLVGSTNPAIIRKIVVFPHPLGPNKKNNSPDTICRSTASTAIVLPKRFVKLRNVIGVMTPSGYHRPPRSRQPR
jgi:hypothetical protein